MVKSLELIKNQCDFISLQNRHSLIHHDHRENNTKNSKNQNNIKEFIKIIFHRKKVSDFFRTVKKNCSGFHFLFSRSRPRFPSRITNRPMLGILRLALSWLAVSQSVSLLTVKRLAGFFPPVKDFF